MINGLKKLILVLLLGSLIISCAPTKNAAYFRKHKKIPDINIPDQVYYIERDSVEYIGKGDELYITISSGNDEPNSFNQPSGNSVNDLELLSYHVDNEGYIKLPYLNRVKADGLSINQLTSTLETELSQYIYLPAVSVRIINNRIAVLGEVNSPGEYIMNRNSFNIYQAIAQAGDIATFGNKKKVLIVRQEGNDIVKKYIDLTNDEILFSSWYYLQPNDIIYVEALSRRNFGMETFSIFDFIGLLTSTYLIYTIIEGI